MLRATARTVKRPIPFHWSPGGRSYSVDPKDIHLPRKFNRSRDHMTPPLVVKKSTAPRAGNGVFVLSQVLTKNMMLGEYDGDIIDIEDALDRQSRVCQCDMPFVLFAVLSMLKIT